MDFPEIILPWPSADLSPNARGHWSKRRAAASKAKSDAMWAAKQAGVKPLAEPRKLVLHYTFCPPAAWRTGDDDNMIARLKASRDGLAQALGIDDRLISTAQPTWGKRGAFVIAQFSQPEDTK